VSDAGATPDEVPPLLRVVGGGTPTDEELAALVTVVTAATAAAADEPDTRARGWADRGAGLRRPLRPGPGAWVASGRPG
jgi:hypothetical protein